MDFLMAADLGVFPRDFFPDFAFGLLIGAKNTAQGWQNCGEAPVSR